MNELVNLDELTEGLDGDALEAAQRVLSQLVKGEDNQMLGLSRENVQHAVDMNSPVPHEFAESAESGISAYMQLLPQRVGA